MSTAPKRYRTARPHGLQPAGMLVEVITLTNTGGRKSEHNRDGGVGGDGAWFRVKYPGGCMLGLVRTVGELAALGTDLGDLTEVSEP